jgi:hypothetical protein
MVDPVRLLPREDREAALADAGYDVFTLDSADVFVDLPTASGTSPRNSGHSTPERGFAVSGTPPRPTPESPRRFRVPRLAAVLTSVRSLRRRGSS